MQTNAAIINTRSRRQAMDWSLVLASQGIETAIEILPDTDQWCLVIAAEDHERSMAAIRQFRLENRGWAWRQKLQDASLWFHWGALGWCFLLALIYWFDAAHGNALQAVGKIGRAHV